MTTLVWLFIGFLTLKIVWNISVPYRLLIRMKRHQEGRQKHGISLSIGVEFFFLALSIAASWLSVGSSFANKPFIVFIYGGSAILVSYFHFFVVGAIGGWLITRWRDKYRNKGVIKGDTPPYE